MKSSAFRYVVVADQVDSRSGSDRVPAALGALAAVGMVLPYERTAGDEIQGLAAGGTGVVETVVALTRLGGWRVGIGVGTVDEPLPPSTRAARGDAYLAARTAIGDARRSPEGLALRAAVSGARPGAAPPTKATAESLALRADVSVEGYGDLVDDAETALWLLRATLARRSREGWELVDLLDEGLTNVQAAARLGITPSAVSQRLSRVARTEGDRGATLATRLLDRAVSAPPGPADTQPDRVLGEV